MKFFRKAVLRQLSKNFSEAIAMDAGHQKPDYDLAVEEYKKYAETLKEMGVEDVLIAPADDALADSVFVEDSYVVISDKVIIQLNPGAESRKQEPASLARFLPDNPPLKKLSNQFTIDGGDILKDGKNIYIGLSTRTQQGAIDEIRDIVKEYGYEVHAIPVPKEILHLKSGMTKVKSKNFVIQSIFEDELKKLQLGDDAIKYFIVPENENHAANVLALNGKIMMPTDCPETKQYISQFYQAEDIYEVDTNQARLVDGALTCSSLLFRK